MEDVNSNPFDDFDEDEPAIAPAEVEESFPPTREVRPLSGREAATYTALMKGLLDHGLRDRSLANPVWELLRDYARSELPRRAGAVTEDLLKQAAASEERIQQFWKERI
jgi:hypothetical protein